MAILNKGKLKGRPVQISQFCNDWFTIEGEGIGVKVVSPSSVDCTVAEKQRIERARELKQTGTLFQEFEWDGWTLKRKRRE